MRNSYVEIERCEQTPAAYNRCILFLDHSQNQTVRRAIFFAFDRVCSSLDDFRAACIVCVNLLAANGLRALNCVL